MRLIDRSVDGEGDNESITCNFFMQEEDMPQTRCGDVLVLHQARVCGYS